MERGWVFFCWGVASMAMGPAIALAQERPAARLVLEAPAALGPILTRHGAALAAATQALPADEAERVALIRRLRRDATEILATEGYFSPVFRFERDAEALRLVVEPGSRARVTEVHITFAGGLAQAGDALDARRQGLKAAWGLAVGQPFRQADWDRAKAALLESVSARDFPLAAWTATRAEVDPEAATVKLSLEVDSGPAVTLGEVAIAGLADYPEDLIQGLNPLKPGEPYDRERLLAFQTALQNTPYFAAASVEAEVAGASPERVPVRVVVTEAKPRRISLGAGYSSNFGARGELGYRDSNLLGSAWDLASGLRLEQRHQLLFADVFRPPTGAAWRDSLGAQLEHSDIEGLRLTTRAVGAVRHYRLESGEASVAVKLQGEERQPQGAASSSHTALTLNGAWTWRSVDDLLNPRRGFILTAELGGASRALLSDQNFARVYGRAVAYYPVAEADGVILRAEGGATLAASRAGIPQDFLFRAGGAQSVRGYAYQSLGVKEGDAVVGGRYLAAFSAEYVHWFGPQWGGAVFADAGNAADDRPAFRLLPGYGAGARWKSPAGPLALDLAYGQADRKLRLHFAIAVAF